MYSFLESFGPNATEKQKDRIREERFKIFNTNEKKICPQGFIKINVHKDGRIQNIKEDDME